MDKNIYCEKAVYDEDNYICWYTGKPCTISPIPNKYLCLLYGKKLKEVEKYGSKFYERSTRKC